MKKKLGLFLKTILFLVLLGSALMAAMLVTERKSSYIKNRAFFDEAKKDHLDVLLLGSSHVIDGINPLVLYDDYGITSYNLGGHGSVMQETYWTLIRALDYVKPDYVIVDCYMMEKNYQYLDVMDEGASQDMINTSVKQLHLNMDAFPLSRLKIAALDELIQSREIKNQFLCDFIVYHDRWSEIDRNDFARLTDSGDTNKLMGAEMQYGVKTDVDVYEPCQEGEVLPEHTVGEEYLMKIIDECQRDGIGILLVYLPFSAETKDQITANTVQLVADKYGVPYINMLKTEGVIDEAADLNDHGHLNVQGAYKVTEYLGQYLNENADLPDHKGEEGYDNWDKLVKRSKKDLNNMILDGSELRLELSLLSNTGYNSIIYINTESPALEDEGIRHLIANISGTSRIYEAAENKEAYILVNDVGLGKKYEAVGSEVLEGFDTSMGSMTYIPVEKKFRLLYPTADESINYLYDDEHTDKDIQILLYENKGDAPAAHLYYESQLREYQDQY